MAKRFYVVFDTDGLGADKLGDDDIAIILDIALTNSANHSGPADERWKPDDLTVWSDEQAFREDMGWIEPQGELT